MGELARESTPVWERGQFKIECWWPLPVEGGSIELKVQSDRLGLTGENLRTLADVVDGVAALREDVGRLVDMEPEPVDG